MLQKIKLIVATVVTTLLGVFLFLRFSKSPLIDKVLERDKQIKDEVNKIKEEIKSIDKEISKVDKKLKSIPDDENWHLTRKNK